MSMKGGTGGYSITVTLCPVCGEPKGFSPGCICTASPEAMSAWQPIETAPKDGQRLIVFDPEYGDGFVGIARYWGGAFRVGDLPGTDTYPTHWMPLPEPPA